MRSMLSAAVLALLAGSAQAGTFTDLATPGAQLTGLSRNGRVAGLYGVDTGWRWAKDIGTSTIAGFAESRGMNPWGQALAGGAEDDDGNQVAALAYSNSDLVGGPFLIGAWPGAVAQDGFLSAAFDTSENGIAVGLALDETGTYFAFRWSAEDGMTKLPVNRPQTSSRANKVSADGGTIVGWNDQDNGFRSGVIWRNGTALDLADADGMPVGEATAVSADGRIVVGERYFNTATLKFEAWRWTEETGVQPLGCLTTSFGCDPTSARAVSDDGNVIVGDSVSGGAYVATAWTPEGGMQLLADYLAAQGVAVPAGWNLQSGNGISADGKTIGGWGASSGSRNSFVADMREAPPIEAIVEVRGTVEWNDLPEGPFAGVEVGTPVSMTFRATSVDAAEIEPGRHTGYPILLDSFRLDAGGATDSLVPTAAGPLLRISNDYPMSDGIHVFETAMATQGQVMEFELFGAGSGPYAGSLFDSDDLDRINRTFGPEFFEKTSWVVSQQGGSFGMFMALDSVSIHDDVPNDDAIFADGFEQP
jgi:uncharacterized membrane protein